MTEKCSNLELSVSVRARGGAGRGAVWQWEVYEAGKLIAIESGSYRGAESKARFAGEQTKRRILERRLGAMKERDKRDR